MRLHLAHGIEHDADNDQQTRAAEKLRRDRWDVQSLAHKAGQNGDQSKKNRARERKPRHSEIEKIRCRFSGSDARNVTTVFLEVVRDLRWLELRGNPKITEEENHGRKSDIMGPAGGKRAGDAIRSRTVLKTVADNRGWEEKQRPRE